MNRLNLVDSIIVVSLTQRQRLVNGISIDNRCAKTLHKNDERQNWLSKLGAAYISVPGHLRPPDRPSFYSQHDNSPSQGKCCEAHCHRERKHGVQTVPLHGSHCISVAGDKVQTAGDQAE